MDEVVAVLESLADDENLTGEAISAVLERLGWGVARQVPGAFPRVWRKDDLLAGIEGDAPQVRLSVTLWEREVDEEAGFDALEALYDESAQVVGRIADEVEAGVLAGRLVRRDGGQAVGIDYIEQRAWALGRRVLLVGAVQDDTELPVRVDAVVS
ncbi:hypothetical protein ABZ608_17205 [Streptomyces sp. NPDC013172]|uniref:hypothetical protein n=1 Tax=Streptomyces sp. NPDC013172 TaxID=3155009 RepID=UPI0033D738B1